MINGTQESNKIYLVSIDNEKGFRGFEDVNKAVALVNAMRKEDVPLEKFAFNDEEPYGADFYESNGEENDDVMGDNPWGYSVIDNSGFKRGETVYVRAEDEGVPSEESYNSVEAYIDDTEDDDQSMLIKFILE